MKTSEILSLGRRLSFTNQSQVDDSTALLYANITYHELTNNIISDINTDYYGKKWTIQTTPGVNKYDLPSDLNAIIRVEQTYVVWGIQYKYMSRETRISIPEYNLDEYWSKIPVSNNQYALFGDSFYVFPTPTESGNIDIYGIYAPSDLTLTPDSTPDLDSSYHHLISIGMKRYIFAERGLYNEKDNASAEFEREKEKMINTMNERVLSPIEKEQPNTSMFE